MKVRHFLYICVVSSILMFASCSETETYNVAPENGLNVRATPSRNGKIIGKLNHLDDVEVISIDGNWAKIEYGDKEAYVYAEYLNVGSSKLVWLVPILLLAGLGGGGAVVHLKKDGTPDMRFKSNRK